MWPEDYNHLKKENEKENNFLAKDHCYIVPDFKFPFEKETFCLF